MYLFLDDSKKSKQVRLVDTVSRIFGESSKDKVSIIAANFFGIPEALASWVRQEWDILSFRPIVKVNLDSEWIECRKPVAPSVCGRCGVSYEADRSRHPE